MKKAILAGILLGFLTTSAHALDVSSTAFIGAMGLINADGNITSYDLQNTVAVEGNPLASPLAKGDSHYINNAGTIALCCLAHDALKDFDKNHGLTGFGTKDIFTIGVYGVEFYTLSNAVPFQKIGGTDVGANIALSEAEFMITSAIFNIGF